METVSTLLEGERNFFSTTYATEEADFMAQLLGNFSSKLPNVSTFEEDSSTFWPHNIDEASLSVSDNVDISNMSLMLSENSVLFPTSSDESHPSVDRSKGGIRKNVSFVPCMEYDDNVTPNSRKRSCSSEDDVSPRPKKVAMLNSNGKKRASNGSATDSQSVYAKKRREKINERLRILQNLVPNGTKVDISTMLEEAVEYVKFLQLQIKLLSSDDLWMYAPIAYNGMDIGLDIKLPSPR